MKKFFIKIVFVVVSFSFFKVDVSAAEVAVAGYLSLDQIGFEFRKCLKIQLEPEVFQQWFGSWELEDFAALGLEVMQGGRASEGLYGAVEMKIIETIGKVRMRKIAERNRWNFISGEDVKFINRDIEFAPKAIVYHIDKDRIKVEAILEVRRDWRRLKVEPIRRALESWMKASVLLPQGRYSKIGIKVGDVWHSLKVVTDQELESVTSFETRVFTEEPWEGMTIDLTRVHQVNLPEGFGKRVADPMLWLMPRTVRKMFRQKAISSCKAVPRQVTFSLSDASVTPPRALSEAQK